MSETRKYRLVTRSDFDGLVCAVLLKELDLIDEILFVHPKDMQDGKIDITEWDITCNLPYCEACYLAFDHHASEAIKHGYDKPDNLVLDPEADSAARVVYSYYGGREKFPRVRPAMLAAVDKADAARFTKEEILNPGGWELLSFLMDPRTGLGRFKNFSLSNYKLMMRLIDYCREHDVDEILARPDVTERVKLYFEHTNMARQQLRDCARLQGELVVIDLRQEETIYACNRFLVYALFPKCNISIHVLWGLKGRNTVFAMGHSIFNRTSAVHVGELLMRYGGGGHVTAGTAQVENERAEEVLAELIQHVASSEHPPMIETSAVIESATESDDRKPTLEQVTAKLSRAVSDGFRRAATKEDVAEIQRRLDRIEVLIRELAGATAPSGILE